MDIGTLSVIAVHQSIKSAQASLYFLIISRTEEALFVDMHCAPNYSDFIGMERKVNLRKLNVFFTCRSSLLSL